ncbi:pre-peptidase C-terminal domain-containing protein [Actinoplanes sp. LDG1-06]|uniref:Pre-peptidase C-terminal domain-containing protein n=1 Tax=Paractinoplanes ovalisporus TaxID=2810368 RepID=A0ABS2AJZ0_9ACTN|nr:PPC domain-containing protein [Actinoplanes ovalisporus]MBM2620158.1 pre-peptidase C-terminal domain-containing protein [Actinoplanes ovalisporus]
MRRSIATVSVAVLGLALITPGAAHAEPSPSGDPLSPADQASLAAGVGIAPKAPYGAKPKGPNPFLAEVADPAKVDYSGWVNYMKTQSQAKAAARLSAQKAAGKAAKAATPPVVVDEDELPGTSGGNDIPVNAQRITGYGTGSGQFSKLRILGSLDNETVSTPTVAPAPEDDGSITLAGATGIGVGTQRGAVINSQIGDGPHGRQTGDGSNDFDFFKITAQAGKTLTVQTATPTGPLDTVLQLFAPDGTLLAVNDDFGGLDSKITYQVPATGDFYAAVAAYGGLPADPFDSGSGGGIGDPTPPTEGPYTLTATSAGVDQDFFAVKLKAGDVIGSSVKGSATYLTVYDTVPREAHGSRQDASFIYPADSPLPAGGNAVTDYVATKAGWHYVGVATGSGAYDITVEAYRPVLQGAKPVQTLYLDFDGARVNTAVLGGAGNRDLSPLAAFLTSWGLTRADEDALIDAVVAGVTENIKHDLEASGLNNKFKIKIADSKNNADQWGKANVSRVVVGGTIDESGIDTIGIAQSIDPGNFETEETALVLLDVLSSPADSTPASLNTYLGPTSDRLAFVAQGLSNVIAHEAGHFFGNFHTDNQDELPNLMDAGGTGFGTLFGVGPDNIGGTADDVDVDFGDSTFLPAEGFVGTEDTLGRIVFGVTS